MSVLLVSNHANACVDCDLNKKAFEKNAKVISVEGILIQLIMISTTDIRKIREADNSVYYDKIKTLEPKKVDVNIAMLKLL